ncbi:hypothetical protein ACLMJK_001624 [Lecanora helva]
MDPTTSPRNSALFLTEPSSILRTPSRRQQFTDREINPLLSNLSPSSTLEALLAIDGVPTEQRHRRSFIQASVTAASTSERAWGIKASLAGKKLREWHQELLQWPWLGFESKGCTEGEYWGGLSAETAQNYEERINVVRDDMETLEVDELKSYVRTTHSELSSRQPTPTVPGSLNYGYLDDFTAIITATIVQALPTLSHLTSLLNIWQNRLSSSRQASVFSKELLDCQESMLSAWDAIGKPSISTAKRRWSLSRGAFTEIQSVLQEQIARLGRGLDNMLDLLEGSQDVLPEHWIDDLESLEKDYSSWVVEAEEFMLCSELHTQDNPELRLFSERGAATVATTVPNNDTLGASEKSRLELRNYPETTDKETGKAQLDSNINISSTESRAITGFGHDSRPIDHRLHIDGHTDETSHQAQLHREPPQANVLSKGFAPIHKPTPLELISRKPSFTDNLHDPRSDISDSESDISDYFSDKSSPEVRNASLIEYVGSPTLTRSPWSARNPFQSDARILEPLGSQDKQHPTLPVIASPTICEIEPDHALNFKTTTDTGANLDSNGEKMDASTQSRARSASMQSIEIIPKKDVRMVMIRRSGSYNSTQSEPDNASSEAVSKFDALSAHLRPEKPPDISGHPPPSLAHDSTEHPREISEPGSFHQDANVASQANSPNGKPLQQAPSHRFQQTMDLGPGLTPVKIRQKEKASAIKDIDGDLVRATQSSSKTAVINPDDRLEARISSILNEIPAHIRLTPGTEPEATEITQVNGGLRTPMNRSATMRLNRAPTSVTLPTMTLAPVQPKSSQSRPSKGEPEIKLYHLHQAGKEVPVKLFVRLVGEGGERVMVRIGGGWADLAEYLKEYASHHGGRSVSDTRFDIQGIPSSPTSPASSSLQQTPHTTPRPSPATSFKRQQTTPGKLESPQTPASDQSVRPQSRGSWTDEDSPSLGLAGPKSKQIEISPRKQAWVDEMLDQARGGAGGASLGDMGKVGGTKRFFLKSRSRAGSNV